MQVFLRIVETNSLVKAAETLGLGASSVTTILKNLETQLGVRLLDRTTRRLSLTPDGAVFIEHCRRILDEVASVEASFPGSTGRPSGPLKVNVVPSIGRSVIIPRLHEFRSRCPEVILSLQLTDRTVDLVEEGVGCVLRTGALADSSTLVGKRIGTFSWMTCASPAYLASRGEPVDVASLQEHECIGYASSRTGRAMEWEFALAGDLTSFTPVGHLLVNDAESYVDCAVAGLGIVRAGSYLLLPHIRAGRLTLLLTQYSTPPVPVSVLYARNRHLSPAIRAFIDWSAELLRGAPDFNLL
jgi:LysR family transcriptional regulator for bpeEF and oprC